MLALLAGSVQKMGNVSSKKKIPGAPEWVNDLLDRVEGINEVTRAKLLDGLSEVAEGLGTVAGQVSRLETDFKMLKQSHLNQAGKITNMEVELQSMRERLGVLEDTARAVPQLNEHVKKLQASIDKLTRELESMRRATPDEASPSSQG